MNEFRVHRPGAVSAFFVYKAGVFATGFWIWLVLATIHGGAAAQWEPVAATGASTTTMVGVVLGARYYLQRNAAARHEQLMQTLVDLSWQSFALSARESPDGRSASSRADTRDLATDNDATANIIPLHQEVNRNRG